MGTKAVRFSDKEEKAISKFLEMNPFLDFSTLARLSIMKFIENPEIKLKAVLPNTNQEKNMPEKTRLQ